MAKENQLDLATEVAKNDVLKKRFYALTSEEISQNFNMVECQLVRRKFGTGNNITYRYTANLLFKKGIFEKTFNLTMTEYNMILYKRLKTKDIPESYKTTVYYLAIKSKRVDEFTKEERTSYQLKVAFSSEVRKKEWLTSTEVAAAEMFDAIKYVDRPELVELDEEEVKEITGF